MPDEHASTYLVWPVTPVDDWTARWIAPPDVEDRPNITFRAYTCVWLEAVPPAWTLHIAAESGYQLWVNDLPVGQGPVRGTRAVNFYDTYEVTSLLRPGENHIAVLVWCMNIPTFKYAAAQPALLVQSDDGLCVTGQGDWQVQVAADWREDVPLFTFQMGFMEWRDYAAEPAGWTSGRGATADWGRPAILAGALALADKRLETRDIPGLGIVERAPASLERAAVVLPIMGGEDMSVAKRMTEEPWLPLLQEEALRTHFRRGGEQSCLLIPPENGDGITLILDFAHELCGGFVLDIEAPAHTVLDVGYEEALFDGRLRVEKGPQASNYAFADRFVLREGRQCVEPRYERGFCLLQLTLRHFDRPLILHRIRGIDRRYPAMPAAVFTCSDQRLNDLWASCVETLAACATDTFVDCPWRESALWVNDLLVSQVTWLQAFGDGRLNARCLRLALSQRREDGLIPGVCPSDGADRHVLVATNLFLPLMLEEYLRYTGDVSLVRESLPVVTEIVKSFARWEDADGLVTPPSAYWNFIDWSPGLSGSDTSLVTLNGFYVLALEAGARLCEGQGERDGAARMRAHAARVFAGLYHACYDARHERFREPGSGAAETPQLAYALTLLSEQMSEQPAWRSSGLAALHSAAVTEPELYMMHLVLRALAHHGQAPAALTRLRRGWRQIIDAQTPTVWEAAIHQQGKEAFNGAGSLCHAFATAPIDFLQTQVLGIRPIESGFALFAVAPQPAGLEWAAGVVPTPHGAITVAYRVHDDTIALELDVPAGTQARLPDGSRHGPGRHRVTLMAPHR